MSSRLPATRLLKEHQAARALPSARLVPFPGGRADSLPRLGRSDLAHGRKIRRGWVSHQPDVGNCVRAKSGSMAHVPDEDEVYRTVIDRLVTDCHEGQGQIGSERVRRAVWNAAAEEAGLEDQAAINRLLKRLDLCPTSCRRSRFD